MAVGIRTEVLDAWADADSIPGLPALLMEQAYRAHLQGGITVYAGILFDGDASDPGLTALGEGFQEPTGILQPILFWQGDMVPAILAEHLRRRCQPYPALCKMGVGSGNSVYSLLMECGYDVSGAFLRFNQAAWQLRTALAMDRGAIFLSSGKEQVPFKSPCFPQRTLNTPAALPRVLHNALFFESMDLSAPGKQRIIYI